MFIFITYYIVITFVILLQSTGHVDFYYEVSSIQLQFLFRQKTNIMETYWIISLVQFIENGEFYA